MLTILCCLYFSFHCALTSNTHTSLLSFSPVDAVNEPVNNQPLMMMTEEQEHSLSCCSCQIQLSTDCTSTDSGYHQAECRLSPDETVEVRSCTERTSKNTTSNSITTVNNRSTSSNMSTRHRRHHHRHHNHQRPTPWTSTVGGGSCSWWSRLLSSSSTSMTSSATSSLFVTLLLLLFSTMLHTAGKLDTSSFALFCPLCQYF